jgi:hypothetical protein
VWPPRPFRTGEVNYTATRIQYSDRPPRRVPPYRLQNAGPWNKMECKSKRLVVRNKWVYVTARSIPANSIKCLSLAVALLRGTNSCGADSMTRCNDVRDSSRSTQLTYAGVDWSATHVHASWGQRVNLRTEPPFVTFKDILITRQVSVGNFDVETVLVPRFCEMFDGKGWEETGKEKFRFWINPLKTKRRLLYLKTQFVRRSKHLISVIETNQFML